MKKIARRMLYIFVRSVMTFLLLSLVTIASIGGLFLIVLAFMDQPPWYSALMIISGIILVGLGDWVFDNPVPVFFWYEKFLDRLGAE